MEDTYGIQSRIGSIIVVERWYCCRGSPVFSDRNIQNEYEEGKLCNRLYSEMRDAYDRICARLGKPDQEDRDVEIIIDSLLDIGKHLSMKMYDYGFFFSTL